MKIVLLTGYAGSGKDAAAALMAEEMDYFRTAFATPLREEVVAATGLAAHHFHDRSLKDHPLPSHGGRTPRELLLGHAHTRWAKDPDVYARHVAETIRLWRPHTRFVVSDWRYEREYAFLRAAFPNAEIRRVRVQRATVAPREDEPEHDLDGAAMDLVIWNDGSISDLRDALHSSI
jgi:hypothetical protein